MNGEVFDLERGDGLSTDELVDAIGDGVRRTVLFHLRQHGAATVPELVDVLVEVAAGEPDRAPLRMSLLHVHLPKLEALGLVSHDADEAVVESTDALAEVDNWLDLGVRRDLRVRRTTTDGAADSIRVLLVDDEPGLPETIADQIEREHDDIEVTTANSVPEASTVLRERSFDCIVSDYKMPAISGLDFLKAVRDQDEDIPFIVYTAKGSEKTAGEAIRTGVTDYVRKRPGAGQYGKLADHIREAVGRG